MREIKILLIGTPNVGKSSIYNFLTHNHEHTGNWAGKTVDFTRGELVENDVRYVFYDLPGTYSIISKSKEEMVATDFIMEEEFDVAVVVCDATSLDKGINLVTQVEEICKKVVVCVNLIDEALKKGIDIDFLRLESNLNCPVVPVSAKKKMGFKELLKAIREVKEKDYLEINYGILEKEIELVEEEIEDFKGNKRWLSLRVLENNEHYIKMYQKKGVLKLGDKTKEAREMLENVDVSLEIVLKIMKLVKMRLKNVVKRKDREELKERRIDRILTSKIWGIPIMMGLLFGLFYLTIVGANYPSSLLFDFFQSLEEGMFKFLNFIHVPDILSSLLVNGIYKTLYWVISVMMPPMLIFFPLFSFLEDLGVLPRIAFNIDRAFSKCNACGKQGLTMCMGIGCNAVGVTGARIIDSKRERLIAILTNVFIPCNGKFPTLIAIITMFMVRLSGVYGSLFCAFLLTLFIFLGIMVTFGVSFILSKTLLKGEASSFTLELPPYRVPKIIETLVYSVKNRAIYVLMRAVKVAIPAGALIWLIANIRINGIVLLDYLVHFLNPLGVMLGLDGIIILALMLGFPANEIVIPAMLMSYLHTASLTQFVNLGELKTILLMNGWTLKTAVSFIILMMFHYPCSTTLLTIKKETGSNFYTLVAFILPLVVGIIFCLIINFIF